MKISIIGAGNVGATIAYTLTIKNLATQINLIDINQDKVSGEICDIRDGLSFIETDCVRASNFDVVKDSNIIIITAGVAQKPGETRLDLVNKNKEIIKSIFENIGIINEKAIIIVVSNPVDIITYWAQKLSKLPHNRVFGTGTSLDTARLRLLVADYLNINSKDVEGFVLGEHGDSEFIPWSSVNIMGKPINELLNQSEMKNIEEQTRNRAYDIINKKGATFYGIAMVVSDIVEAIIFNQNKILPLSVRIKNYSKDFEEDICISYPCILGENGIVRNWAINMTDEEKEKQNISIESIKKYI